MSLILKVTLNFLNSDQRGHSIINVPMNYKETIESEKQRTMITQTKETQAGISAQDAHQMLVDGNKRFLAKKMIARDFDTQVNTTSQGQYPFAVTLSCIDSRVPVEIVFDQGIGDIFSARVAGNISNEDVLGSMEYACKVAGSKIVVVLGHTKCGAVTSACKHVELGNITALLSKIQPAVSAVIPEGTELTSDLIEEVVVKNVHLTIDKIREDRFKGPVSLQVP